MSNPVSEAWEGGLPPDLTHLIPAYLGRQRWFGGSELPSDVEVRVERSRLLSEVGPTRVWQAVVALSTGDHVDHYQLLLGERPIADLADVLVGNDVHLLGTVGEACFYDLVIDSDAALSVLEVASGGAEKAMRVRPVGAEQSNTSLVYDDRVILKVYRHLHEGSNPDIEVTSALAGAGFTQVAEPVVIWRDGDVDLAFGQQFLAGGSEGWALALTSLRDLYNSTVLAPEEAGGDFAAESARLGQLTARMHLAMARAFPEAGEDASREVWDALLQRLEKGLAWADATFGEGLVAAGSPLLRRLRRLNDPGPMQRVHGDYHLGQVMRTDGGWFVLDFEGEPAVPLADRAVHLSPMKDVAGMLRSFHYACRRAMAERDREELDRLEPLALAWEARNRQAFLEAYRAVSGIDELLPPTDALPAVIVASEVDKALYELAYEQAHRPDWVGIPMEALHRLLDGAHYDNE